MKCMNILSCWMGGVRAGVWGKGAGGGWRCPPGLLTRSLPLPPHVSAAALTPRTSTPCIIAPRCFRPTLPAALSHCTHNDLYSPQGNFDFNNYEAYKQRLDESWGFMLMTNQTPIFLGESGCVTCAWLRSTWRVTSRVAGYVTRAGLRRVCRVTLRVPGYAVRVGLRRVCRVTSRVPGYAARVGLRRVWRVTLRVPGYVMCVGTHHIGQTFSFQSIAGAALVDLHTATCAGAGGLQIC